jgi:hypothetical protein
MTYIPQVRSGGFIMTTGVTFAAFASGFGVCLFNLDTVSACLDTADSWVDTFLAMGNHMLQWGIALLSGIWSKS